VDGHDASEVHFSEGEGDLLLVYFGQGQLVDYLLAEVDVALDQSAEFKDDEIVVVEMTDATEQSTAVSFDEATFEFPVEHQSAAP
jgi:hypothetical protein